jgi:WD40 repeat protein
MTHKRAEAKSIEEAPLELELLHTLRGHAKGIAGIQWSPDGQRLASGSDDCTARIWNAATGDIEFILKKHTDCVWNVEWAPDGRSLATGGDDGLICLWDASAGTLAKVLGSHEQAVRTLAWSPSGRTLASGALDSAVRIWDPTEGKILYELPNLGERSPRASWSADGKLIAAAVSPPFLDIFDAQSGALWVRCDNKTKDRVTSLLWPPGNNIFSGHLNGTIQIWSSNEGRLLYSIEGHTDAILSLSVSADGRFLASKSDDEAICIWNADTWSLITSFTERRDATTTGLIGGLDFPSSKTCACNAL